MFGVHGEDGLKECSPVPTDNYLKYILAQEAIFISSPGTASLALPSLPCALNDRDKLDISSKVNLFIYPSCKYIQNLQFLRTNKVKMRYKDIKKLTIMSTISRPKVVAKYVYSLSFPSK